jgi:predicted acyltransferase
MLLGFVFWLVDVLGRRLWALPFKIYGMNAIAAFVAAGIVVRVALILKIYDTASQKTVSLLTFCQLRAAEAVGQLSSWLEQLNPHLAIATPANASLAYSIGFIIAILILMSILYLLGIFIKV